MPCSCHIDHLHFVPCDTAEQLWLGIEAAIIRRERGGQENIGMAAEVQRRRAAYHAHIMWAIIREVLEDYTDAS